MGRNLHLRRLAVGVVAAALLAGCAGSSGGGSNSTTSSSQARAASAGAAAAAGRGTAEPTADGRRVQALIPPAGAPARAVRVPVLTYHRVAPADAPGLPDLKVSPGSFEAELAALARAGYRSITQTALFDALYQRRALAPKPVLISVDDGYIDDVTRILPALRRWHMVATFFVITGRMGEPGFLSAAQIRALDRSGMDVGDHTAHHLDLRLLRPAQLRVETAGSREALERVLGHAVYTFAYPFGAYNTAVVDAVRSAGFTLAYTTAGGTTERTSSPLTLPRIHVGHDETAAGLTALLTTG